MFLRLVMEDLMWSDIYMTYFAILAMPNTLIF